MPFRNELVEIRLGNIESRLVGPVPRQFLFRALNPHVWTGGGIGAAAAGPWGETAGGDAVLVYDPTDDRFLTGALPAVRRALRSLGVRVRLRDRRRRPLRRHGWQLQGHPLREYQEEVVASALRTGRGLVDVGTGGGKTLLAAAIIARLGLPALYVVTTRTLLHQTVRALRSYLGEEPGVIGDGSRRPERLTAALVQSLEADSVDLGRWRDGVLVFDEGHHAAARTYIDVVRRVDPRYHYYLSAVPFRRGPDQVVLDALAGAPLTGGKYSARFLIEKGYACDIDVRVERCRMRGEMHEKPFHTLYREFIVENAQRNGRAAEIAARQAASGRSVLILVEHTRHGEKLLERLGELLRAPGASADFVHGGTGRSILHERTAAFAAGRIRCLIATCGLFMEGVSIDGIEVLINAGGLKSRAKVLQSAGRGMRRAPGKSACLYIDFLDEDPAGIFLSHARQRLRFLKEEGFFVPRLLEGRAPGPETAPEPEPEPEADRGRASVPPTWWRVPSTRTYLLVDGDGIVHARADCWQKERAPRLSCKRCAQNHVCRRGENIQWLVDPA
ncbi:MAG: DEAD/DEAH box helicase family protein [Planctomycetes bacterium]|nr:DEAD/DEAH box helicase family protein [Planctomycetota bacterium]